MRNLSIMQQLRKPQKFIKILISKTHFNFTFQVISQGMKFQPNVYIHSAHTQLCNEHTQHTRLVVTTGGRKRNAMNNLLQKEWRIFSQFMQKIWRERKASTSTPIERSLLTFIRIFRTLKRFSCAQWRAKIADEIEYPTV